MTTITIHIKDGTATVTQDEDPVPLSVAKARLQEIDTLRKLLSDADDELEQAKAALQKEQVVNQGLIKKLDEVIESRDRFSDELSRVIRDRDAALSRGGGYKKEIAILTTLHAEAENEVEQLREELEHRRSQSLLYKQEGDQYLAELKQVKDKLEVATSDLSAAEEENTRLVDQLHDIRNKLQKTDRFSLPTRPMPLGGANVLYVVRSPFGSDSVHWTKESAMQRVEYLKATIRSDKKCVIEALDAKGNLREVVDRLTKDPWAPEKASQSAGRKEELADPSVGNPQGGTF